MTHSHTENKKRHWYIFTEKGLLLTKNIDGSYAIPYGAAPPIQISGEKSQFHIHDEGQGEAIAAHAASAPESPEFEVMGLRDSWEHLSHDEYLLAGKAYQLLFWDKSSAFCGICGNKMIRKGEINKVCSVCGNEIWPQLAPAVIVLIKRGDEILLVQSKKFKSNYLGLVAGFLETGETLEECVKREVQEETQVQIKNIRYFGSQPWPYPSGVMIGFVADYVSGTIKIQKEELRKGGWFSRDNMPAIPSKLSIARQLIDAWLAGSI